MTKKKKMIIAAVAVVLIAGGLKVALGSRQTEPTGTPVTTGTVVRQDLEEVLKQKATLEGTESAEVASKLHYEVKQVLVKEGDKVTKGQLWQCWTAVIFRIRLPRQKVTSSFWNISSRKHWQNVSVRSTTL